MSLLCKNFFGWGGGGGSEGREGKGERIGVTVISLMALCNKEFES